MQQLPDLVAITVAKCCLVCSKNKPENRVENVTAFVYLKTYCNVYPEKD